jgi:hypothetical protein
MSWVRSAIVISLVALLAGCDVSSGSASSSSEQHGLLPSGRVYHAITTTPEHGKVHDRVMTDNEWVDVGAGRIRMELGDGRYHNVTIVDGRTGLTRTSFTSSAFGNSSSGSLWHALPSEPLPSGLYSSSVFDIVSAAVRGDDNVYDRPLRVVKTGDGYTLTLKGPKNGQVIVKVVGSITPDAANGRRLFAIDAPHPQQVVTQLTPGARPDSGAAYWVGPKWRDHDAGFTQQTVSNRHGHDSTYSIEYGARSADPWAPISYVEPLTVTTSKSTFPGFQPRGNKKFFIRPVGGKKVMLADGTKGVLVDDVISYVTISGGGDQMQVPNINSFLLLTHGVEVSVMGTFADKDIERIAGALRPV